jgi:hypothetical protein
MDGKIIGGDGGMEMTNSQAGGKLNLLLLHLGGGGGGG